MNFELVERIRRDELDRVLALLPGAGRVLDVGAGAGWQSRALAEAGYRVEAIEREQSSYRDKRVWQVTTYDGERVPFPDASFDIVFSSNVLEHVPHVEALQAELLRVLAPGGVAVHVLPTPSWRVSTTLTHYPDLLKRLIARLRPRRRPADPAGAARAGPSRPALRDLLIPPRHGTFGNVLSEAWWFSRRRWLPLFMRTGWDVAGVHPVRLFYSGNLLLGALLPLPARRLLSRLLGSSGLVYVLTRSGS